MNRKYEKDVHPRQVAVYIEAGLSNQEIAKKMNIGERTLSLWKAKHPEFKRAFEKAKKEYVELQCDNAEAKLYQRCIGYHYEETEVITDVAASGKKKKSRVKVSKKYSQPDIAAIKTFLYNRRSSDWAERQSIDIADNTEYGKQREKIKKLFDEVSGSIKDEQDSQKNQTTERAEK